MVLIRKLNLSICILLALMLSYAVSIKAQCTGCTTIITGGSSNFSVNPGQVVCIGAGITYTGNITLNGGALCNEGILSRVVFKSGIFNNYGSFNKTGGLSINNSGNLFINCYAGSTFSVENGVTLKSINISDSVVIVNNEGSFFTTGKAFTMNNTNVSIYNGSDNLGLKTTFNIGAQLFMGDSSNFKLRNFINGYFNVAGNLSFNATGNKSVVNYGIFNVNNSLSMSGNANPADLVSIINNGNFNVTGNISAAVNFASVIITNNPKAILSAGISVSLSKITNTLNNGGEIMTGQDLSILNGKVFNSGLIMTARDIKVNNGFFANNSLSRAGRNFVLQTGATSINTGNIFAVNSIQMSAASFTNSENAFAVASVSANIQNTSSVLNNGTINANGDLKMGTSFLTNNEVGVISTGSNCIIQSTSSVTNSGTITTVGDLRLIGSIFNTNNFSSVGNELQISGSSNATNNGTVSVISNVNITTSTLTNNNFLTASNNFSTTNTSALVNNNGYILVGNEFKNIATVNSGQGSLIQTTNYYNLGINGQINGPNNPVDTLLYAKIIINGYSENTGFLNGRIIFDDQSLVSTVNNIGYGFDQISNSARIATTVLFGSRAVGPGNGNQPVTLCLIKKNIYSAGIIASPSNIITCGQPVALTGQLQIVYNMILFPSNIVTQVTTVINQPGISYSWLPAAAFNNPNLQTQVVSPIVNTTYTLIITYKGCVYKKIITITVNSILANAGPDKPFVPFPGNFVQIGGTPPQTGGTPPYSYNWSPNLYFTNASNNTQPNPYVNPPVNTTYILSVTDANGCIGIDQMDVYILEPTYAILAKNINGGIYDVTTARNPNYAGQLHFKFDDDYVSNANGLNYKVYNMNRQLVVTIPSLNVVYKDNRYSINLSTLPPFNSNLNSYYVLEITDKKGEKTFLRFKY